MLQKLPVHKVPLNDGGQIHTKLSSFICWQVAPFLQGFGSHLFMAEKGQIFSKNEFMNQSINNSVNNPMAN